MGKIYINCARCGKDLECEELDDVYTSKIDDTFLCKECFEEEKPEYIQQLKQQLKACQEARKFEVENHNESYKKLFEKWADEVNELKQQLEEAQTRINELEDKDWFEATIKQLEEQNNRLIQERDNLKLQLAEKDKEIERLNTIIGLSQLQVSEKDRLNTSVNINSLQYNQNNQTQLAIQELEKVKDTLKHFCDIHSDEYYGVKAEVKCIELDVCESIDYQIRELKGE